jgi:long-chain acyl-CoA synthetase
MKNQQYELYDMPNISDLKDMLWQKNEKMPEKNAFTYAKRRGGIVEKTYHDFYSDVNALGAWEYMNGMNGVHIAVIGENSYEWLTAFFSIVNGGNVAVPIDKELPKEEVVKLVKKADVSAVFCSDAYMELVSALENVSAFSMSEMENYIKEGKTYIEDGNAQYLDYRPDKKKMCCILFTSGTSGESKGVMLSHENIAEDINGSCKLFVLEGNTIAVLPFHHAFGLVVGVLMVFNYGYTTHINSSLKRIQKDLQIAKPQTMFLVPLFIETFSRQIWAGAQKEGKAKLLKRIMKLSNFLLKFGIDIRKKCFSSVRAVFGGELQYIISGGAGIDAKYIREFRSFGVEILNGYGTTECSPCAAVNRNHYHKDGTVGLPVPGTSARISKDGEVLISGSHVMLGYYNDEAATSEVLHDGWYHTGDLGKIDKDGFLTLTGRKKNLIILSNGENISPEEIEKDFLKDMAVNEVVVYENTGIITAEIYPEEEHMNDTDYFQMLMKRVNKDRPVYKQVGKVLLRDTEFSKNTSKKIIRH